MTIANSKDVKCLDVIKLPKSMLETAGIWPTKNMGVMFGIRKIIFLFMGTSFFATMCISLYYDRTDFEKTTDTLYYFMTQMSYLIKVYLLITVQRSNFITVLNKIDCETFKNHPIRLNVHLKNAARGSNRIAKMFRANCFCCVFLFFCFPFLDNNPEQPYPLPFPFNVGPFWYYVVYTFQIVSIFVSCWVNSSLDSLYYGLADLGSAQFQILMDNLKMCTDFKNNAQQLNLQNHEYVIVLRLKECINHYTSILSFIDNMETVFSPGLLAQYICSGISFCLIGFQLILVSPMTLRYAMIILYLLAMLFQLALYCFAGQNVITMSSQVSQACYMSDWYKCGYRVQKLFVIIMEYAKKPVALTAGKFFKLSLNTFANIIRTSYSYFAVLQSVYQEE